MAKIKYEDLAIRVCEYCKTNYKPSGPAQKACDICRRHLSNIDSQVKRDVIRFEKFGTYEYVGKGFSNKKGKAHLQYKSGIGYFNSVLSKKVKRELRYCQDCGKDLVSANRYEWCAHHIDHDRTNNTEDNITLLCKRCHQIEHECWKAFNTESATTIPEGSTPK